MKVWVTGGEVSDYKGYEALIDLDLPPVRVLLADKGYDSDFIRENVEAAGGTAIIPMRKHRLQQDQIDGHIYALRNLVERCFNKLKIARRLATRYDKTLSSYLGFIEITSVRLWIKSL